MPASRKDLMFDMRRSEEAEGESRIIGSGRRPPFLGRETSEDVLEAVEDGGAALGAEGLGPGRGRFRPRKISAVLRMWEKSCHQRGER